MAMGANFGDIDNDGYLDFYLGTGAPSFFAITPNRMFRSDRGLRFLDVTSSAGVGHIQKGHGVAFADFDNDGDQDIYQQMGATSPPTSSTTRFTRTRASAPTGSRCACRGSKRIDQPSEPGFA